MKRTTIAQRAIAPLAAGLLLLAACSADSGEETSDAPDVSEDSSGAAEDEDHDEGEDHDHAEGTRVVATTADSVIVLDGDTLEVVSEIPLAGFKRANPAADGIHAFITTEAGFQVVDAQTGELTGLTFEADTAGHVVNHAGSTVLFADGTGDITIFDSEALVGADTLPEVELVNSEEAHHGVAVELADGRLASSLGGADGRVGLRVLDSEREEIARSEECPGVHGEGALPDDTVIIGCENGVLIYDAEFHKVAAPDQPYGRTGNLYVSEGSTLVVGDYKNDPDAEGSQLNQIALIDTEARTLEVIDLADVRYTWKGVARGPHNEIILVGNDGKVHVYDETGTETAAWDAITPWEDPVNWQDDHPTLKVLGHTIYVSDPAAGTVVALDSHSGEILATAETSAPVNEFTVVAAEDDHDH